MLSLVTVHLVTPLECSSNREAYSALLFKEERIIRLGVRVPREYQSERHVDNRDLHPQLAAEAITVVIEYPCDRVVEVDGSCNLLLASNRRKTEAGRQKAWILRRARLPYFASRRHLAPRVQDHRSQETAGNELATYELVFE